MAIVQCNECSACGCSLTQSAFSVVGLERCRDCREKGNKPRFVYHHAEGWRPKYGRGRVIGGLPYMQ